MMALSISVACVTCVFLIVSALLKSRIGKVEIYPFIPLVGAAVVIAFGVIDLKGVFERFSSADAANPVKIIVLFISASLISVLLDETGFLEYVAYLVSKRAGKSQAAVFLVFYSLVSVLTVFTSNDVVILTFTPFICKFAKKTRIDPIPFVIAEFVAANSWSMLFLIGNPTNVYLTCSMGIEFLSYLSVMWLPTLLCGVGSLCCLLLIFRKSLKKPLEPIEGGEYGVKDKFLAVISVASLFCCVVLLAVSSYVGLEMWLSSLCCCALLFVVAAIAGIKNKERQKITLAALKRLPWQTAPLVVGMFVVVLSLERSGATAELGRIIGLDAPILRYGVLSTLAANFLNNIPMSVLFSSVIASVGGSTFLPAVYATVIGSNVGAFLTPLGALAGLMFSSILKDNDVKLSFARFSIYGAPIALCSLACSLLGLWIIL